MSLLSPPVPSLFQFRLKTCPDITVEGMKGMRGILGHSHLRTVSSGVRRPLPDLQRELSEETNGWSAVIFFFTVLFTHSSRHTQWEKYRAYTCQDRRKAQQSSSATVIDTILSGKIEIYEDLPQSKVNGMTRYHTSRISRVKQYDEVACWWWG